MHAAVTPTGVISFRHQYRVNGRQEVMTIGRYSAEADTGSRGAGIRNGRVACGGEDTAGTRPASGRAPRAAVQRQGGEAHRVSRGVDVRRVGGSLFQAQSRSQVGG
ncbi:hypothetical protein [Xanthobacter autotrophicus]|uniref:hypothetical protein n=1 Tax=Xanthobacter autotrophicus TaxID=280 RepID=UPI0037262110